MGTSNFYSKNASKVFAVLMDTEETFKECSECGHRHYDYDYNLDTLTECENGCKDAELTEDSEYRSCEQYEYDDLVDYVRECAEEKIKDNKLISYQEEDYYNRDRNYGGRDIFSYSISKWYVDIAVEVRLVGTITSGYYEGANLDWRLEIYNGGEWSEVTDSFYKVTVEDIIYDLFEVKYKEHNYSSMSRGLRKILFNKASNWAEKNSEELINLIEEVFTEVSIPLNVVCTFSNGETIYSKA